VSIAARTTKKTECQVIAQSRTDKLNADEKDEITDEVEKMTQIDATSRGDSDSNVKLYMNELHPK
jgi:hypothetical protein